MKEYFKQTSVKPIKNLPYVLPTKFQLILQNCFRENFVLTRTAYGNDISSIIGTTFCTGSSIIFPISKSYTSIKYTRHSHHRT
jgi:hypothetical protein